MERSYRRSILTAVVLLIHWLAAGSFCWGAQHIVDLQGGGDFTEIQPAIDAAAEGDTVLVKPGEYLIEESISFLGKSITLRGENGGVWRVRANNRDYEVQGIQSTVAIDFEALDAEHKVETGVRYHVDRARR